ncbi:MAG: EamA family transporter [Myxococcales bacterium]|nr:EamA family transporter [Myxococcales bacterium]
MGSLIAATLLWALSFGLIRQHLTGLDPTFVAWARMLLALPVLLPFVRPRELSLWPWPRGQVAARLAGVGAVQYGLMYTGYIAAFGFAAAHEVALFTVTTPLYVCLIVDARERRLDVRNLGLAALAVAGAVILQPKGLAWSDAWVGFCLVQASNLCFAWGQVAYRRLRRAAPTARDHAVFAWLYAGGLAVTTAATTIAGGWASAAQVSSTQAAALLYLGVVASGLGFYLWNRGAVTAPAGALAVFNNLKIPAAVVAALTIFGERADLRRLALGGAVMLIAAALAARRGAPLRS